MSARTIKCLYCDEEMEIDIEVIRATPYDYRTIYSGVCDNCGYTYNSDDYYDLSFDDQY